MNSFRFIVALTMGRKSHQKKETGRKREQKRRVKKQLKLQKQIKKYFHAAETSSSSS